MNKDTHNYGIDLLRLLAFAYVITLHTIGHGGIIEASAPGSGQYMLCAGMEIWAYCAVNLFGLVSGFVGYRDEPDRPWKKRFFSYLALWLQVVFYAVVPSLILYFLKPGSVTAQDLLHGLFPVTTGAYWYFSAYTGLFLLIPVLNAALRALDAGYLKHLLIVFLVVFSLYASPMERFTLQGGYSTFWLVLLYLAGGAVKKLRGSAVKKTVGSAGHDRLAVTGRETGREVLARQSSRPITMRPLFMLCGITLCALFSWIWLICGWHFTVFGIEVKRTTWMNYTSFTVTLAALLHLQWFSKIRIPEKIRQPIRRAASCSFGIYLLNTQPAIWKLTAGKFAASGSGRLIGIIGVVLINILVFMAAGLAADFIRQLIFGTVRTLTSRRKA